VSGGNSAKVALRDQVLTARNRLSLAERAEATQGLSDQVFSTPEVVTAATVAAYVSVGSEPGTAVTLSNLWHSGIMPVSPCSSSR